jgi:hypothetical protein
LRILAGGSSRTTFIGKWVKAGTDQKAAEGHWSRNQSEERFLNKKTFENLAVAVNRTEEKLEAWLAVYANGSSSPRILANTGFLTTIPNAESRREAVATGRLMQERKNILQEKAISRRFLLAERIPTLVECVAASNCLTPAYPGEKDVPHAPSVGYNHFIQVGVVITAQEGEGQQAKEVLAYHRSLRPEAAQFALTQGMAVLWGASFEWNLLHTRTAMDDWMVLAQTDGTKAREVFTQQSGSTLAALLRYKIDLCDLPLHISPLAVITNDLRTARVKEGKTGRIYTQYTFRASLSAEVRARLKESDLEKRAFGVPVVWLPARVMPVNELEDRFSDHNTGKKNLMDILAWQSLFAKRNRLRMGTASLRRGFHLVV